MHVHYVDGCIYYVCWNLASPVVPWWSLGKLKRILIQPLELTQRTQTHSILTFKIVEMYIREWGFWQLFKTVEFLTDKISCQNPMDMLGGPGEPHWLVYKQFFGAYYSLLLLYRNNYYAGNLKSRLFLTWHMCKRNGTCSIYNLIFLKK